MGKIQRCSEKLEIWNKRSFGTARKNIPTSRINLQKLQTHDLCLRIKEHKEYRAEVHKLLEREEIMRQRSKALRLKERDQNTKWFYNKASQRKKKNLIKGAGNWQEKEGRDKVILDFFRDLFTASDQRGNMDFLESLVGRIIVDMNEELI